MGERRRVEGQNRPYVITGGVEMRKGPSACGCAVHRRGLVFFFWNADGCRGARKGGGFLKKKRKKEGEEERKTSNQNTPHQSTQAKAKEKDDRSPDAFFPFPFVANPNSFIKPNSEGARTEDRKEGKGKQGKPTQTKKMVCRARAKPETKKRGR